ncbi:MAG: nickel/cobalt transporter [Alphaproteobacteria bacterium]
MRRALIRLAVAWAAATPGLASAQDAAGDGGISALWTRWVGWIMAEQRAFHDQLADALRTLADDGGGTAAWLLISASFLYGLFHAAGPGHGKAVLATYLLAGRQRLRRGIGLAAAAAFCQAVTAVVLVYGLIHAAGWLPRETSDAVGWSERVSFALVLLMGAWLVLRAVRAMLAALRPLRRGDAGHVHHPGCGHAHLPTAEMVDQVRDLRGGALVVLAIGLRPCTGAVLVLAFAHVAGIAWAGVAAVATMAAGTALAVAAIALVTVSLRSWAATLAVRRAGRWSAAGSLVGLAGGALLIAMGLSLLIASFAPSHPLGL